MKADIEGYLNEADKLAEERSVLIEQVEDAQRGLAEKRSTLNDMQNKLDAQKALNAELQAKRDNLLSAKSQGTKERAFNDQLRHIKHNLATEGQTTLDNGAVVKYVTSGSDSFVTIEAPEGNFSIDVSAVKGGVQRTLQPNYLKPIVNIMLINTKWMCCRASLSQLISRSLNRSHNQHHILIPGGW